MLGVWEILDGREILDVWEPVDAGETVGAWEILDGEAFDAREILIA